MTRLRLTVAVTGRLGPYEVLTEEAVRGLADRLASSAAPIIPVRLPDGELALGELDPATITVDELTPDTFVVHADVDLDDKTAALATLDASDAITVALAGLDDDSNGAA